MFSHPKLLVALSALAAILGFGAFAFINLGNWLLISDPEPKTIDLIFTFAGGPYRDDHSIDLLKKHPEAKWLADLRRAMFRPCGTGWQARE